MKKAIIIISVVVIIVAAFVIFGGTFSSDNSGSKRDPNDNPNKIYIGVFEPLTGVSATGGNQEALGIRFANEDAPTVDVDGVKYDVVLTEVDNMSENNVAEATAGILCDRGVAAVIGSYGSGLSLSGAPVFSAAGIPALGVSCTNPKVTQGNDLYFRVCYLDSFQGKVLANFAKNQNYGTAAVVTQVGDVYSKGLGEYFTAEFEALGGKTEQFTYNSAQTSFSDLAADIKRCKANVVFLPGGVNICAEIIRQTKDAGLNVPYLGGDTWDTEAFWSLVKEIRPEIYFSSYYDSTDTADKAAGDFAVRFQTWVSRDKDRLAQNGGTSYVASVSALGYDAYMVTLEAIKAAKSVSSAKIAKALGSVSYSGCTGDIVFDGSGDPGKRTAFIKTVNTRGEMTTVQKSTASE